MIATKDSFEPQSSEPLPNCAKIHVHGKIHAGVRVPFREIQLSSTKSFNGKIEANAPLRVYDCSGPWGDAEFNGEVDRLGEAGLIEVDADVLKLTSRGALLSNEVFAALA